MSNSDDFFSFVDGRLPIFVEHYKTIRAAEVNFNREFASVYYNGAKGLTLQYMAILASIDVNDSSADVEKKIKIVSYYLDYYTNMRTINNKDNTYDNIRDDVFSLCKRIRRKNVVDLIKFLSHEIARAGDQLNGLDVINYRTSKNKDILHLLARFADYLEEGVEQTNRVGFPAYVDRDKGTKTFDIEHIIPNKALEVQNSLGSNNDFEPREINIERDRLGALILLPRSRNRAVKAMLYNLKTTRYAGENILAQTLVGTYYENNPQVQAFIKAADLPMAPIEIFNKAAISARLQLYKAIAGKIWNIETLVSLG